MNTKTVKILDTAIDGLNVYEKFMALVDEYLLNGNTLDDLGLVTLENVSAKDLNVRIHEKYNSESTVVYESNDKTLKINSKVIQTCNNFELNVMNGEIGYIVGVSNINNIKYIDIDFNDRIVQYKEDDLKDIELAYVLTIYKAQNLRFNQVIFLVTWLANTRFDKSVLDTALRICNSNALIIGDEKALLQRLTDEEKLQYTRLIKIEN